MPYHHCHPCQLEHVHVLAASHLEIILSLPFIKDLESFLSSFDAGQSHGPEGRPHAICTIDLTQLHASNDETWNNLTSSLDDRVLGSVHVQATHTAELLNLLHGYETFDAEGTERPIVPCGGDDNWSIDSVWVHAGLVVVVHGDESPVCDYAGDAECAVAVGASDEILHCGGVEEFDVREGENFRE